MLEGKITKSDYKKREPLKTIMDEMAAIEMRNIEL
jgi:hypothetical protein